MIQSISQPSPAHSTPTSRRRRNLASACVWSTVIVGLWVGCRPAASPTAGRPVHEDPAVDAKTASATHAPSAPPGSDPPVGAAAAADEAAAVQVGGTGKDDVTGRDDGTGKDDGVADGDADENAEDRAVATDAAAAPDQENETGANATAVADPGGDAEATETPGRAAGERFVLLPPGGPVIVEVILQLDGAAHKAALERLVERAFQAADEDGDGQARWEEVATHPRFRYGQFGNLPIENDAQVERLVQLYDRDRDGLVDRDELPRFLTRNAGQARSFALRSSNLYRSDNRTRSRVRRLLDRDRDGAITREEAEDAPAWLLSRDADDDSMLTLTDFRNDPLRNQAAMANRRRTTEPDSAFAIHARTDWAYAHFALAEVYSYGDVITPADWPASTELFEQLDADQNGTLVRAEIERLAQVDPQLRLLVAFGETEDDPDSGEAAPATATRIELVETAAWFEPQVIEVHSYGRLLSLTLADAKLAFFINEDEALVDYQAVADRQFQQLDADQNGYLDEEEFPDSLPGFDVPFEGLDLDADGQLRIEELATFLDLRQAAFRGQVRARAADHEDALFTALDLDSDGRLTAREIQEAPQRLRSLDRDENGRLQSHEIPGSMLIGFVRGNPQRDAALFMPPVGRDSARSDAPVWFQGMDANGDGEVGAVEFLGPAARFQELDANRDGFLSRDELP